MKTAIYIEDGIVQLVLTPQNKWEKDAMKSFKGELSVQTFTGSFYDCRGGWIRQDAISPWEKNDDESIMIRIDEKKEEIKQDPKSKFVIRDISDVTLPDAFCNWPESINIENLDEKEIMTYKMNPTEKLLIIKKGD